jgi:hypothetical protein
MRYGYAQGDHTLRGAVGRDLQCAGAVVYFSDEWPSLVRHAGRRVVDLGCQRRYEMAGKKALSEQQVEDVTDPQDIAPSDKSPFIV